MNFGNQQVKEIFFAAQEQPDPAQRRALLDRECAGATELRAEVERLLSLSAEADRFFGNIEAQLNPGLSVAHGAEELNGSK